MKTFSQTLPHVKMLDLLRRNVGGIIKCNFDVIWDLHAQYDAIFNMEEMQWFRETVIKLSRWFHCFSPLISSIWTGLYQCGVGVTEELCELGWGLVAWTPEPWSVFSPLVHSMWGVDKQSSELSSQVSSLAANLRWKATNSVCVCEMSWPCL